MSTPSLDPLFEWLFSLSGPSLKWDIETARAFTARLGHPHRHYRLAHIAGTNGKGSVAAMIHAMAQASGLTAGLFSSPHLVRPEERIRIGDEDITPEAFAEIIGRLREEARRGVDQGELPRHPSFFEMICAAALVCFAERKVDLAVLETGLGGRLDATNVVFPGVSVITTIARDHVKSLGGGLTAIAGEKAGIIKPGIPVLAGWIEEEPARVLRETAHRRGAPFHDACRQLSIVEERNGRFSVTTPERTYHRLRCSLAGAHQRRNAALALRAAELLRERGLPLDAVAAARGLATVRWAGRMERIGHTPSFLLDAAHNMEGITALGQYLEGEARPPRRVMIFGLTEGRQAREMLGALEGQVDAVIVTPPRTAKAISPERILEQLEGAEIPVESAENVEQAVPRGRELAGPEGEVLVSGSLYLVGDVRRVLLGLDGPWRRPPERVPDLAVPPRR